MYKYFPDSVTNTERPNNHDEIYAFLQMYFSYLYFTQRNAVCSEHMLKLKNDKKSFYYSFMMFFFIINLTRPHTCISVAIVL